MAFVSSKPQAPTGDRGYNSFHMYTHPNLHLTTPSPTRDPPSSRPAHLNDALLTGPSSLATPIPFQSDNGPHSEPLKPLPENSGMQVDPPQAAEGHKSFGNLKRKPVPSMEFLESSEPLSPVKVPSPPPMGRDVNPTESHDAHPTNKPVLLPPLDPWSSQSSSRSVSAPNTFNPHASSKSQKPSKHYHSGSASEGGTAIPVDMKRLLSKPALPSSSASAYSVPSHVEPQAPHNTTRAGKHEPPSRTTPDTIHFPRDPKTHPAPASTPVSKPTLTVMNPAPRTRNVLRRRPSAGKDTGDGNSRHGNHNHSVSNVAVSVRASVVQSSFFPSHRSAQSIGVPSQALSVTAATSNTTNLNAVPSVRKSPSPTNRHFIPPPPALTPAGAVAQAYKQQEAQGNEITQSDSTVNSTEIGPNPLQLHPQLLVPDVQDDSTRSVYSRSPSPLPYYTVLGSENGTVIAVGSPEDDTIDATPPIDFTRGGVDAFLGYGRSRESCGDKEKGRKHSRLVKAPAGPRTLSKKGSGKWKKVIGVGQEDGPPPPAPTGMDAMGSDLSLHEQQTAVASRCSINESSALQRSRSVAASHVETSASSLSLGAETEGSGQKSPTCLSRDISRTSTPRDEGDRLAVGKDLTVSRRAQSELLVGGKIWRLMKRISSGGIRDKYAQQEREALPPLPPVPAIPRQGEQQDQPQRGVLSKLLHTRASTSLIRKGSTLLRSSKPTSAPPGHAPTRSSSPGSSDVASSRLFYHAASRSTRSSSSSYGEEVPPLPAANTSLIGRHILPPHELSRLNVDGDQEQGLEHGPDNGLDSPTLRRQHHRGQLQDPHDDYRVIDSPEDEHPPSLPFPPPRSRRQTPIRLDPEALLIPDTGGTQASSPSPTIPSFSTAGAINTFGSRRLTPAAIGLSDELREDEEDDTYTAGIRRSFSASLATPKLTHHNLGSGTQLNVSAVAPASAPPARPARSAKRAAARAIPSELKSAPVDEQMPMIVKTGDVHDESERPSRGSISDTRSHIVSARKRSSSLGSISTFRRRRKGSQAPALELLPLPSAIAGSRPSLSIPLPSPCRSPASARLTEQEKAEKWHDLLERSEKAGGTLHLGTSELVSDRVRLSDSSDFSIDLEAYT